MDTHTCSHVQTPTHPIKKQNLSRKTKTPDLFVSCKTPWHLGPLNISLPVSASFLNGFVVFRDIASLPILFTMYITQCVQTHCFYLLCYGPKKGPCVFCPWPSCLNIFPVSTFSGAFICLLFQRKNLLSGRGILA